MTNTDNKKYIKQVKSLIPFNSKDKKEYLKLLERQITEYCGNTPDYTYDSITVEFGTPNETAGEYIQQLDTTEVINHLKKSHIIKTAITIFIIAIISISLFKTYRLNQLYEEAKSSINGYYETTINEE